MAVDSSGNIYIPDKPNNRIRKVPAGVITTIAGTGSSGYSGDGGPAINAELRNCSGVTLDGSGILYIADTLNHVIREVELATGIISTVAGTGSSGYSGRWRAAINAELRNCSGVTLDGSGILYIADTLNYVIREVELATGIISTVAGNGGFGYSGRWRARDQCGT